MKRIKTHISCPDCNSSDALVKYEDGHTWCFSCKTYTPVNGDKYKADTFFQYIKEWRNLTKETLEFFNIQTETNTDGEPIAEHFFFEKERASKVRFRDYHIKWLLNKKEGDYKPGVYYSNLFSKGSSKSITIVEGVVDAPAVYQMLGSKYPVVSLQSSATALKDCKASYEYLNSFDKIYICMDNDSAGKEATKNIVSLFNPKKCYIVNLSQYNDPTEYLENNKENDFIKIWWNSKTYSPANIIVSFDEIGKLFKEREEKPSLPYPFPKLQEMSYGMREGEVHLITALEGIGKTEIIRSVEHSLLTTTSANLGIIHVEEDVPRCVEGLVGLDIGEPCHIPEKRNLNDEKLLKHFKESMCQNIEGKINFYNHFGSEEDDTILNDIRFMAASNQCKVIFLDHISILVSGNTDENERIRLDNLSTQLAMLAKELGFTLILVSHVNDDGRTRGSRNISKIANVWLHLDRDPEHPNPLIKNTTTLRIRKNRHGALTGIADKLFFNSDTFKLEPLTRTQDQEIQEWLEKNKNEEVPF